jgi:2-methylcitrate dehydratase PrpD
VEHFQELISHGPDYRRSRAPAGTAAPHPFALRQTGTAAYLAQDGFTGARHILEGPQA